MRQVRAAPFPAITTPAGNFVVVTFCPRGVKGEKRSLNQVIDNARGILLTYGRQEMKPTFKNSLCIQRVNGRMSIWHRSGCRGVVGGKN